MCTALNLTTKDHYFGRNLDLDRTYNEEVCIMPRRFSLKFRKMEEINNHFALIGMATVVSDIPLFYDAANEHGLSAAALNFPKNAYYSPAKKGKDNISPFEFIPWILCKCKTVEEAKRLLYNINIADIPFSEQLPLSPLHWIISDRNSSLIIESMKDGLHIHESKLGVLTNNPPFEYQIENLQKFSHLRNDNSNVIRENNLPYETYSQGLGAVGLPGDVSSMSRFVRIAFGKANSVSENDELASVGQFFHLLSSVEMIKGNCKNDDGNMHLTHYSACINTDKGLYYYTTYNNRRITCIDMHRTDLESENISRFPLITKQSIKYQN